MKVLKTTGKVIGMVGSFALAGVVLVGHFIRAFYNEYSRCVDMRYHVARVGK